MAANEAKIIVVADDKASKTLTGIGEKAKSMRGAFLAVGAAGAAVTGAIALSIKSFAQAGDEIQKMALRTGLTTESLSELKFALEQSGTTIEGFEKGIRRMSSFIADGRDGLTETTRALDSLGISVSDFDGLSPEENFDLLAGALAGVTDATMQSALAQDIFGRSGTALIPLLKQGEEGIAALRQEAHDLGIVFDQDAANAAARLVDAQNTLSKSFQGVQFALAEGVAPALSGALEKMGVMISKVTEFAKENPVLTKTIVALAFGLGTLAIAVAGIGLVLPIMATGLGFVTAGFIGLNLATGGIIIAIGALAAGIVLLIQNWDAVVEAVRVGVNFMIGAFETYVNAWITGLNFIIDGVNVLGEKFGLHIDNIASVQFPRWKQAMKDTEDASEELTDSVESDNDRIVTSTQRAADAVVKAAQFRATNIIKQRQLEEGAIASVKEAADKERIAAIIAHQDRVSALDKALADKRIEIQEETIARELNLFQTRQDQVAAIQKEERERSEEKKQLWLDEREAFRDRAEDMVATAKAEAEKQADLLRWRTEATILELARMADAAEKLQREEFAAVMALGAEIHGRQFGGASLAGFEKGGLSADHLRSFGAHLVLNPITGGGYGINQAGERVAVGTQPPQINVTVEAELVVAEDLPTTINKGIQEAIDQGAFL